MKKLTGLLLISLLLLPAEALASHGVRGRACYKEVWREEYVPGNIHRRGYVRRWKDVRRIPCNRRRHRPVNQHHHHNNHHDNNSCVEGALLGGILGGGAGAVVSRGDGRWIGVPIGIVAGSLIGCQVDGG